MTNKINVLKPELVWLGDRCYRKIPCRQKKSLAEEDSLYPIETLKKYDEDEYSDIPVEIHGSDELWIEIHTPNDLMHVLLPKAKVKLERETEARITFRKSKSDFTAITIKGRDKRIIGEAHSRIQILFDNARLKMPFTHFISLPMNFDVLQKSFMEFKRDVLKHHSEVDGMSPTIFQNPSKLHLTIVPLILLDRQETEKAAAILQNCKDTVRDVLHGKSLTLTVKGVEYMNDDPSEVDVLYAKIQEPEDGQSLQIIVDSIFKKFEDEHLTKKQQGAVRMSPPYVKLHITLMNTTFRSDGNTDYRQTFDARDILKHYADYDFGIVTVSEIHVSVRSGAQDRAGYYGSTSVLKLNS